MIIVEFYGFTDKSRLTEIQEKIKTELGAKSIKDVFLIEKEGLVRDLDGGFQELVKITSDNFDLLEVVEKIITDFGVNCLMIDNDAVLRFVPKK